jgi:rubredoxin
MNMEHESDEITSYVVACEAAQAAVISSLRNGESILIDGVMSPISVALSARLAATEFDMNSWWVATPQSWVCPACGREKIDIARLNTKKEIMCHLVEHHDHMKDVLKRRFQEISVSRKVVVADEHAEKFAKRSATMISAYENTLICVDCNNADVTAKKAATANRDFSFSPQELLRIVKPASNKAHAIDVDVAVAIWAEQQGTFELRIKIANRIAEIAANNEHWFQPGDINCNPDVIERRASAYVSYKGAYGVLELLKGPKKAKPVKPASAWRQISYRPPKPIPTQNEIEHAGQVGNPKYWNVLNEEWRCPGCQRNKREIVRKNKDGEWMFSATTRFFFDPALPWNRKNILTCGDCVKTAENLGKEAASRVGGKAQGGYTAQVNIQEVQRCVIPRPHTRHNIDNDEAELILENIVCRILHVREEAK